MTIKEAKAIDMVFYLSTIGYEPAKIKGDDYWYLSPFRDERTPSFKVNRKLNKWFDFGEGKGGSLIDFLLELENDPIPQILNKLERLQLPTTTIATVSNRTNVIEVIETRSLFTPALINYYQSRRIAREIAHQYLCEVDYTNGGKFYYALGFKNDAGGYELRSPYFKGSSSPKAPTTFKNNSDALAVFEGFFNFLSYQTIYSGSNVPERDFVVLNSTSFFQQSLPFMQTYLSVHLYLDNDPTGDEFTNLALSLDKQKFIDERSLYRNHKDLNDWHRHFGLQPVANR